MKSNALSYGSLFCRRKRFNHHAETKDINLSRCMMRLLILTIVLSLISCDETQKELAPQKANIPVQEKMLERGFDTLPNGKRLLDNMHEGMVHYYKELVSSDTLKGGYIACYGFDDSAKYFYLRRGDKLHLLNQEAIHVSAWSLGKLEKDFDSFIVTVVDKGNGVPSTYQIFEKETGENRLGSNVEAWDYEAYNDSLFFLFDNQLVDLAGNYADPKSADSIFLYNATSGRREGFALLKKVPSNSFLDLKIVNEKEFTFSWRQVGNDGDERLITYRRSH